MSEGLIAGRYVLSHRLGQGGMGVVWRARDELLEREVAVKEVRLPAAESDPDHRRTMREARAAARLRHPGIVTVYDVVLHEDRPWIVMELLGGPSLAQVLDQDGPLPPVRVAAIALQLVEALQAAHREGILHRDVKPANVLLDGDRAVLTDFGIATMPDATALTASGMLVGSPEYTAPERIHGTQTGTPADLWALGVTLYTALAGRSPFRRDTTAATLAAVLSSDPDPLPETGTLWPAITGLLHKDPAHRLTTDQVRPLLNKATAPGPEPPTAPGTPNPAPTAVEDPRAMDTISPDTLPRTRTAPPDPPPIQVLPPKPPDPPSPQVPPHAQRPRQHAHPEPPHQHPPRHTAIPKGPILTTAGALLLATVVLTIWLLWPDHPSRAGTGTTTTTTTGTTTEPAPTTPTTRPPPGPPVPPADPESLAGTWSGTVNAPNAIFREWPISFTLSETPSVGSVFDLDTDPTLGCTNTATIKQATMTSFVADVRVRDNPLRRCATRSTWTFALRPDGRLYAAYQDQAFPTNTGTAVLTRQTQ